MQVLLSELSRELYEVSGGGDLVSSFKVELPASWRNTECTMDLETREGRVDHDDILVTSPHPLLGDVPVSQQFGGCGARGLRTTLPFSIITDNAQVSESKLNLTILELTRWRYGVFSETGISGDNMYPQNVTLGLESMKNEGCNETSRRSGRGLCPLNAYNRAAATKQNLLCAETPARQTILEQFVNSPTFKFEKAEVEFVIPSDTERVILLIEHSQDMVDKWSAVLSSTFQYINSLPEGVELSILTFGLDANVHLQPTRVVGGNREGLHYRIPRRVSSETSGAAFAACVTCGMSRAESLATNTSTILVLSSSVTHKNNTELMKFQSRANPIIRRIVFGKYTRQTPDMRGSIYMINEDQSTLNISSDLSQGLASMTADYPSNKFHLESLTTKAVEGSFSVEPSLSSDLWIQILLDDTTDINVFEIKSPSGQIFSFPKFDAGLVYFSLRGPRETGVWSYKIRFYGSAPDTRRMILECWGSGGAGQINLESWTKVGETDNSPVHVYARLDQAGLPVLNAKVYATINKPGSGAPSRIELQDNGSGYPDITRGDGIYTGYFSQFSDSPGFYSVSVEAINNSSASVINTRKMENTSIPCCGSSLPLEPAIPLESFRRFTTAPSVHLNSFSEFYVSSGLVQRRDTTPPSRITDFRLANYFNNSLFVTLAWSAPGDDFSAGQAFRYEVRCFTARDALSQKNFGEQGIQVHSSLVPSPGPVGGEQRCTVGVPWPQEIFYYAIVAFDAAGNAGQVSNIISVYVKEPLTTTTENPTTRFLDMKDVSATLPLKSFIHSESLMYIIAGIISFILIIIVIILTVIIRRLGVCSKKNTNTVNETSATETPSLPDLCHEQSYMRNSISYMSGYDLPEMLEYALRSPQKASAQEIVNNNYHRSLDNYHVVNSTKVSSHTSTHEYSPRYTTYTQRPSPQHSPSISPVNSTFTVGQSTDCSVSVSGSDHEMTGEPLQVVTPSHKFSGPAKRPEPKPRKIPPTVPNKTVHASLV